MSIKLLWTGLTFIVAVPLVVGITPVVGAVLMIIGCVLMWLEANNK